VIFSDAGPDVRWIGNERGVAGETNWSTVDPAVVPYPGAGGAAVTAMLQHGDPNGTVWRPGETDVSIRPGWFHHPAEDARVKSADDLVSIYFTSVGRNSKLLLNVPPTRDGLLHDTDVSRLADMRARLDALFAHDVAARRRPDLRATAGHAAALEIDLGGDETIALADLREDIARGQVVARYTLEGQVAGGEWRTLASGTTIGYRKLDRFASVTVRRVRLRVDDAIAPAAPMSVRLFEGSA
jgi:alpha-L-fucosidase